MANDPARQDRMPSGNAYKATEHQTTGHTCAVIAEGDTKQTESGHQDRASGTSNGGHPKGLPFVAIDHLSLSLARNTICMGKWARWQNRCSMINTHTSGLEGKIVGKESN